MTVKQFKDLVAGIPVEMDRHEVFLHQTNTEFGSSMLHHIGERTIYFSEEPGSKVLAKDQVFVLTDEI